MRCLCFIAVSFSLLAAAGAEEVSSSRARKYSKTLQALVQAENKEELTKFIDRMGQRHSSCAHWVTTRSRRNPLGRLPFENDRQCPNPISAQPAGDRLGM